MGPTKLERWLNHKIRIAAQIKPEMLEGLLDGEQTRKFDKFTQLALISASEALVQSGLQADEIAGPRTAVVLGSGVGGQLSQEEAFLTVYREPPGRLDPMTIARIMISAPASVISMRYGVTGPTFVVSECLFLGIASNRNGCIDGAIRSS